MMSEPFLEAPSEPAMPAPFMSASTLTDATALRREFGDDAAMAARLRAEHSRGRDNARRYCHWREVERLLAWMDGPVAGATRH